MSSLSQTPPESVSSGGEFLFHLYRGSELLQDCKDPQRYLTVDRWESVEAWRAFRSRFAADYERLDRELEGIASRESALGAYRPAGEA